MALRIDLDEEGGDAEAAAKFHVHKGVSDHDTGGGGDAGELSSGLLEEARQRLAAVALAAVVGADEKGVDMRAVAVEQGLEGGVNRLDVGGGVEPESDAALVGDDHHAQSRAVEQGDGLGYAGQDVKAVPGGYITALRHLLVENSVAVEEDGGEVGGYALAGGVGHGVMIATLLNTP